jgi:uncharacterized protein (UPF0332 family)
LYNPSKSFKIIDAVREEIGDFLHAGSFLVDFYTKEDVTLIKKAFDARNITQYHADKVVDQKEIDEIMGKAHHFVSTSKEILIKLNEDNIKKIVDEFEKRGLR